MGALVIYESMFGNTKRVAEAIAAGIGERLAVEVLEVSHAPLTIDPGVDLLVVGGPTHMHGMTSPKTRAAAAERTSDPLLSPAIGMREWLELLAPVSGLTRAAAFDTRINGPKVLHRLGRRQLHSAAQGRPVPPDLRARELPDRVEGARGGQRAPRRRARRGDGVGPCPRRDGPAAGLTRDPGPGPEPTRLAVASAAMAR